MRASNAGAQRWRRRFRNVLVLIAGVGLAQYLMSGSGAGGAATDVDLRGRVVRITDGDTVTLLDHSNTQHKVRLYGIDSPERDQPYGKAAKNALTRLIDNRPVGVIIVTKDRYGRTVGTLYRDGVNLNEAMVAAGYAWWYEHYASQDHKLAMSEQQAREQHLGLWADPHPVPPWDWRRSKR